LCRRHDPDGDYVPGDDGCAHSYRSILCWNLGNRILTPLNGVLFMDILPVTTFAVSALTGVVPGRAQIIGAGMTGAALILNNIYLRRRALAREVAPHPA